uniref:Uncharacterized protein n=1 Tax=Macrostomum lignano TaxID=282301 RepID=A0A1I8G9Z0_9PLAT
MIAGPFAAYRFGCSDRRLKRRTIAGPFAAYRFGCSDRRLKRRTIAAPRAVIYECCECRDETKQCALCCCRFIGRRVHAGSSEVKEDDGDDYDMYDYSATLDRN